MKQILVNLLLLAFILLFISLIPITKVSSAGQPDLPARVSPEVRTKLASVSPSEKIPVIVRLVGSLDTHSLNALPASKRDAELVRSLKVAAQKNLSPLRGLLDGWKGAGQVSIEKDLWLINGFAMEASPAVIEILAARPEIISITVDAQIAAPPELQAVSVAEQNLNVVNAPALWDFGYTGQGIVIASIDTGVQGDHPELASRWRGGTNSWFDPYGEHPDFPVDKHGHGTMTMGVMVGGDGGGTSIGIAPGAKWIAARIYSDQNFASFSAIHQAFQWLLDPDGDPATADYPDVVNNSWVITTAGCNPEFLEDVQALKAVGILPIFAAGNFGPDPDTSRSPGNYLDSFSVGSVSNLDAISTFSGRGPSSCDPGGRPFPDLVAPGEAIRSTSNTGSYGAMSGTSISAPQVAAGLALLLSAYHDMTLDQQREALISAAVDLGDPGADNLYGSGRLDLLAAYQWLAIDPPATLPLDFRIFLPFINH